MDKTRTTMMLRQANAGDRKAVEALLTLVYEELRGLAAGYLRRRGRSDTLQPTALVHEAYLRLADQTSLDVNSKTHFFAIAAQAMRWVLADHVRNRSAEKRGGEWKRVTLSGVDRADPEREVDSLALFDALEKLARQDERAARIVECRFFGGMSIEDTASALGVSEGTVKNEWRWVRAWLLAELGRGGGSEGGGGGGGGGKAKEGGSGDA